MNDEAVAYWRQKIAKYSEEQWATDASIFAKQIRGLLPESGTMLELGCGLGVDGAWFAENGFLVTQADLEDFRLSKQLPFVTCNMEETLQITEKFDVVYAHLSLHYFSYERTKQLLNEISNVLNESGILAFLVNSVHDTEVEEGDQIEENYRLINKIAKRFFSVEDTEALTKDYFQPLLLDEEGTSHKDKVIGLSRLVRFVGQKK